MADKKLDPLRCVYFLTVHLGCLLVFLSGFSWFALGTAVVLYWLRMFAITGGFHRYFSHRSYETSRIFQFCLAFLGTCSGQKGPLWWAAHHRVHHQNSDRHNDVHSPIESGFFWSHVGWILCRENFETKHHLIQDFAKYPEILWLDRHFVVPPFLLALFLFTLGFCLQQWAPSLGVSPLQLLAWGFFVSTTVLYHITFSINSLGHLWGGRRYDTKDASRNNFYLAFLTMGEGWHNNHHRFPQSERQGFYWWEIDFTHYTLKTLAIFGLVWKLRSPPKWLLDRPAPE